MDRRDKPGDDTEFVAASGQLRMLLIEADGKALLREAGIATPDGAVVTNATPKLTGTGPWIVKAQVPVGGRGKAGGVICCETQAAVHAALKRLLGAQIKGHT